VITISRRSPFSGKVNTMTIPLSEDEYAKGLHDIGANGMLIQVAFPTLTADQREFLRTGITPEEWANIFSKE